MCDIISSQGIRLLPAISSSCSSISETMKQIIITLMMLIATEHGLALLKLIDYGNGILYKMSATDDVLNFVYNGDNQNFRA